MADEVTISNLALSRLGDEATISDPGEGSVQAEHCQAFFPIARRTLLEMFPWDFATGSVALALQSETVRGWQYAYAKPDLCLKVLAVLPPEAADDYSVSGVNRGVVQLADGTIFTLPNGYNQYQPQPFKTETSRATGAQLILTNQTEADGICIFDVEDTGLFSAMFDDTLAWLLASYVAGPIYKGKTGFEMSQLMLKQFEVFFARATASNASQEMTDVQQSVPWLAGR
jgi:hypothetical protein